MLKRLLLPFCAVLMPFTASAQKVGEWVHSRGNPAMTGLSDVSLRLPLKAAWTFKTMPKMKGAGEMMVSSAVARDGKAYLGNKDGTFYCLDLATGKELWKSSAPKGSFEGAAAFSGPLVIAGSTDFTVYAWDAQTGLPQWKFEAEGEIHAAANVWHDPKAKEDRLLIGSHDYKLYCLKAADGTKVWEAETGYYINGGSAISADGKTGFGGCDGVLHVHDVSTGKELKQVEIGAYIGNNVALADGIAYLSNFGNQVAAYALGDGARVWEFMAEREFEYYAAPAVTEKLVVVGGRDKRLHCLDRITGKQVWEFKARDRIDSSAVICAGKHAIFGCDDGYLYVVDLATGKEVWSFLVGAPIRSSPAIAGDYILVGADDGVVYAFTNGAVP